MKRLMALLTALTMLLCVTSCAKDPGSSAPDSSGGDSAQQEIYTLKMAVNTSDLVQVDFNGAFSDRINEATDGRIVIEYVEISGLGGNDAALTMLRDGMVDLYKNAAAFTSTEFPLMIFADIPMQFPNGIIASNVFSSLYYDGWFDKELEGFVLCEIDCSGMQKFFTVNEISSLADLKDMKIRVATGTAGEFVSNLGAVPVAIGRADTYLSLQTGIVEGMINTPLSCWENSQHEVTNYIVDVGLFGGLQFILMNEDKYNSFPVDLRLQLKNFFSKLQNEMWYYMEEMGNEKAGALVSEKGLKLVTFSEADKATMKQAQEPLRKAFIAQMDDLGYDTEAFFATVDHYVSIYSEGF